VLPGVDPQARPAEASPKLIRRLLPPGDPSTASEIVAGLGFWERPAAARERPRVVLNMASTADGHAAIGGRSGPIGGPADRELFHALRTPMDAVMAGAGTVRTERYGRIIRDQPRRRARLERGMSEEPLACIVSASLALPADLPLLTEPAARVAVLTTSAESLPKSAAQVEYVRAGRDGPLDLRAALVELRERFAVGMLLCEGGPHLNSQLLSAGLVDELFLSLAPRLTGGDPADGEALGIVAGRELEPAVGLELLGALEHDSYLFLRYAVSVRA